MGNTKSIGIAYSDQDLDGSIINVKRQLGFTNKNRGVVTQLTSKSTSVTLNAPVGTITTSNSALNAGTSAIFTFNNSFINSKSLVLLNFRLASDTLLYLMTVKNVTNGSVDIILTNPTGLNESAALVINFTVINGNS